MTTRSLWPWQYLHRHGRDERGTSLILALAFVSIFGVAITASLEYADTSLRQDGANRSTRDATVGADAATQTLINAMRHQLTWGRDGATCNGLTYSMPDGRTASVSCAPRSGSGDPIAGDGAAAAGLQDYPLLSGAPVASPSSSSEPGVTVSGSGTLQVLGGSTFASTSFAVGSGSTYSLGSGTVHSDGTCANTVPAGGACLNYAATTSADTIAALRQDAPFSTAPAVRTAPSCPGSNKYLALSPGTYTDASALSALTNGGCPGLVLHLLAGDYYFGFTQTGAAASWVISDPTVDVIGGTPKGWTVGPWTTRPTVPTVGACRSAYDPTPSSGVVLVFGAQSQLSVTASHNVELCAIPVGSGTANAIFGLDGAITGGAAQSGCVVVALGAGGCPFISVSGSAVFNVEGVVQAANANVTLDYASSASARFNWGVLLRSVVVQGLSGGQTVTPFSARSGVPIGPSGYADRDVVLTATIAGVRYVRARVEFVDASGDDPGSRVKILEWSSAK